MVRIRFCSKLGRQLTDLYQMKIRVYPVLNKKSSEAGQCVLSGFAQRLRLFRGAFPTMCGLSSRSKYQLQTQLSHPFPSRREEERQKVPTICLLQKVLGCCFFIQLYIVTSANIIQLHPIQLLLLTPYSCIPFLVERKTGNCTPNHTWHLPPSPLLKSDGSIILKKEERGYPISDMLHY